MIARDPVATRVVKVCWEAADPSTNCGTCEKCVRTRLNFKAVGIDSPSCFAGEITPAQIRLIRFSNESQRAAFRSILAYAEGHALRGDWLDAMKECLRSNEKGMMRRAAVHLAHGDFRLLLATLGRKLSKPFKGLAG